MKKASFKKYTLLTLLCSVLLFTVFFVFFSIDSHTNTMLVEYAKNMGWAVIPSPVEITHFKIPAEFDSVYETYNEVQKKLGFDLEGFRGKSVSRYTYRLENHEMSDTVRVFLGIIVYDSRIIAADIYSTDMEGFLHGIGETSKIKAN